MIYIMQIEIDGTERWLNKVDYEYFKPMPIDEDLYKKFFYIKTSLTKLELSMIYFGAIWNNVGNQIVISHI